MSSAEVAPQEPWVPPDSFASRLILVRHHLGLTQVEAAKACGLDDGSWSNWERGSKPRAMDEVVAAIATGLKVDRDWLMWGVPKMHCLPSPAGQMVFFDQDDTLSWANPTRPLGTDLVAIEG